jgi:hypothetical protein
LFCRKFWHVLCLLDLRLNSRVLVIGDLLGDQRCEDLPSHAHQLAGGKVRLQHPFIRATLIGGGAPGDGRLVARVCSVHLHHVCTDAHGRRRPVPAKDFAVGAKSPIMQINPDIRDDGQRPGRGANDGSRMPGITGVRKLVVKLVRLIGVEVELTGSGSAGLRRG